MHIAIALLLTIAIIGCQKDSIEFVPNDNQSQLVTANIFGVVIGENNDPLDGALVSYRGNQTVSDQYGVYAFNNVDVDSKHNVLNISKDGYHLHSRTFRSKTATTIQLTSKILPLVFDHSFQSSQGGIITSGETELEFAANSIVFEESEAEYQGEVQVAIQYANEKYEDFNLILPGDLSTINKQDEIQSQEYYGAVSVVLQSTDGQKLQIKNGNTVKLKLDVPAGTIASDLSAGSFDHNIGLWKEETEASIIDGKLVADVSHFTWWNIYKSIPHINIDGKIVDQNGNSISNKYIRVYNDDGYIACYGSVEADGTFSGIVPKDESLTFNVYDYAGGCDYLQPVYSSSIGPYAQDTHLGDLVIVQDNTTTCSVSGTAVDCDNNVITDGFIKLGNSIIQVNNGTFDASIIVCDNDPIRFIATDRASQLSSVAVMVDAPGTTNLGNVSVCADQADFFTINCDALSMSVLMNENIGLYNNEFNGGSLIGFGGNTTQNDSLYSFFRTFSVPLTSTFDVGQYVIDDNNLGEGGFNIYESGNTTWSRQFLLGTGTVDITSGGGVGSVIKGTFTYEGTDTDTDESYSFYGSFQILY